MKRDEQNIINNNRKARLFQKLENKEYREAFVEENINIGIPLQVKAMREQRQLTQKDIAKISGMPQSQVARYENLEYSSFSLNTLKKIASTFEVGLIVRFVPISEIVEWELNIDSESFKVLSYEDDPYFKEEVAETVDDKQALTNSPDVACEVFYIKEFKKKKTTFISLEKTNASSEGYKTLTGQEASYG